MKRLRRYVFGIKEHEVRFSTRGFSQRDPLVQKRLEHIGSCFAVGYHSALEEANTDDIGARLSEIEQEFRGFAFEGAGMALALQDTLFPAQKRLTRFLDTAASAHRYLVIVGAGWVLGRLPLRPSALRAPLDPLLGWLTLDGYGFHNAYFQTRKTVYEQAVPRNVHGYECRVFDQGVGRCLWFVHCADVEAIAQEVARFPVERRADLWSGIGLACAYAGGASSEELKRLVALAGALRPQLAQGTAFAAKARYAGQNPTRELERIVPLICGMSASEAATITDQALVNLGDSSVALPSYETWRRRIQHAFGGKQ